MAPFSEGALLFLDSEQNKNADICQRLMFCGEDGFAQPLGGFALLGMSGSNQKQNETSSLFASACTGVILKEKVITVCGGLGASLGLLFLPQLCKGGNFPLTWTILMAIAMIISLVVPGHILNYKAKKVNA